MEIDAVKLVAGTIIFLIFLNLVFKGKDKKVTGESCSDKLDIHDDIDFNNTNNVFDSLYESDVDPKIPEYEKHAQSLQSTRSKELKKLVPKFGVTDLICPYCESALLKFPKRKSICKACKSPIFPRLNPVTDKHVLLKYSELVTLDELKEWHDANWVNWKVHQSVVETEKKNEGVVRSSLANQFNISASKVAKGDIQWRIYNTKLARLMSESKWGSAVNTLEDMIRQLSKEDNFKNAIPLIAQFVYLTNFVRKKKQEVTFYDDGAYFHGNSLRHIVKIQRGLDMTDNELNDVILSFLEEGNLKLLLSISYKESIAIFTKDKIDYCKLVTL